MKKYNLNLCFSSVEEGGYSYRLPLLFQSTSENHRKMWGELSSSLVWFVVTVKMRNGITNLPNRTVLSVKTIRLGRSFYSYFEYVRRNIRDTRIDIIPFNQHNATRTSHSFPPIELTDSALNVGLNENRFCNQLPLSPLSFRNKNIWELHTDSKALDITSRVYTPTFRKHQKPTIPRVFRNKANIFL